MAMREQALHAALDEMTAWLDLPSSQVAVFDATNSTEDRRNKLVRVERHRAPLGGSRHVQSTDSQLAVHTPECSRPFS